MLSGGGDSTSGVHFEHCELQDQVIPLLQHSRRQPFERLGGQAVITTDRSKSTTPRDAAQGTSDSLEVCTLIRIASHNKAAPRALDEEDV